MAGKKTILDEPIRVSSRQVVRIDFHDPDACHAIIEANPEARGLFAFCEYGAIEIDPVTLTGKLVKSDA